MRHMERERGSFTQILELTPAMRSRIEAAVEGLLGLLDELDASDADREEDDFGGGDINDEGEPSLGSLEEAFCGLYDQRRWSLGADDDREDEHDGREQESAI